MDPCRSHVLPDVICSFCNFCQDLDLCRDPSLATHGDEAADSQWRCAQCNSPYDRSLIELTLVENMQRLSLKYQLQDLRCSKTKEVKQNQMGLYSVLASKLECEVPAEQVTMQVNTMRTIADYRDFPWLRESVDFLLQAAPVEHMEQEQVE